MTRYASLAYKRTHHQAGFDDINGDDKDGVSVQYSIQPKKKRRTIAASTTQTETSGQAAPTDLDDENGKLQSSSAGTREQGATKAAWGRDASVRARAQRSESRRVKRIEERQSDTVCFACREKGHTAKHCPKSFTTEEIETPTLGICYRCGSKKHTLARCKQRARDDNPLPFAVCFVCSSKGHLASGCPKNHGKGVYPNGGSCKLCGETSHLAKDCELRSKNLEEHVIMVTEGQTGADEDDFHVFKRKQGEVEREVKAENRQKRDAVRGSSTVVSGSRPRPMTKVVAF